MAAHLRLSLLVAAAVLASAVNSWAQIDARMLRYPDVSATQITFVYAGDIWVVPKAGGLASRLSSPPGEESYPRFSPDGSRIAYSANYDGNTDVYVVATMGGEPTRLTYHPMPDRVIDWRPDGRVLFASSRESGRQRYNQFYLVGVTGGLPEKLAVPYGELASYAPDGQRLAYVDKSQANRTWKRYRGGWAADIWLFDLRTLDARKIAADQANDEFPMWSGQTIYFLSDRGPGQRFNIWAFDTASGSIRQVTDFRDADVSHPALGPTDIVFQAGGQLHLLNLSTQKVSPVAIQVVTDQTTLRPRPEKVASRIRWASVSPTGKRALFEARGDVFSLPAEHGPVVDLTNSSGVAERYPRWSPDGKTLAYWSDRRGEYELTVRNADGSGAERTVTSLGAGYRYAPWFSPDSKSVAFIDEGMRIRVAELASGAVKEVDQSPEWFNHGRLESFVAQWSPDSRWIAWSRPVDTGNPALFLYDTRTGTRHQVSSGYFSDLSPVFDPEGKYLFYLSDRSFEPVYSDFDNTWVYPNATRIVAVPLRADVKSPLAARNDEEGSEKKGADEKKTEEKKADESKPGSSAPAAGTAAEPKKDESKDKAPAPVSIDLDGFEARAVVLPPKAGNYSDLFAVKGKVLYRRPPRTGSGEEKSPIVYYDLEEREEKTVLEESDDFEPTVDGKKLLVASKRRFAIVDLKAGVKFEKPMNTADMEMLVDPRAEWRQMFADAYRFQRDFFYDANMHGVDWASTRAQYAKLLEQAVTRWDVNFVLGEFIGELNASHTYRGGGDEEASRTRGVGLVGVDWELSNGAYRVKRIVRGGPWDVDARAPLAEPGLGVREGEYVLAVNGIPLDPARDPWAAFQGMAGKTVALSVSAAPTGAATRQVTVACLEDDTELRFREWIEQRRKRVDDATKGRAGYVYVQSTGVGAQNELVRQFTAQWRKEALVIDERFNSGGQIPDRFVELLNRPALSYWATRHGRERRWPPVSHQGPKVMLINGWSGSGGDAFPFYFREAKIGPLIGTRTWGGLIGISGAPELADGGQLTVPTFRMFDVTGKWFAEGHGVEPDIPVDEDPSALAKGTDPQLERAIKEAMDRLATTKAAPVRPAPERRTAPVPSTSAASRP